MQRFANWPELLVEYIDAREKQPFQWGKGKQDCCSFASGGVFAMTGADLMADLPDYSTSDEADEILRTPLEELLDARMPRCSIGLAQRGDIALAELNGLDTVVIVEGDMLVGPGKRRLQRIPRYLMTSAWTV